MLEHDADTILSLGLICAGCRGIQQRSPSSMVTTFRKLYGLQPESTSEVFTAIQTYAAGGARIQNPNTTMFFMTIYWLRSYDKEEGVLHRFSVKSRMTLRKYTRLFLNAFQALSRTKVTLNINYIRFSSRMYSNINIFQIKDRVAILGPSLS
jgi:hypothetical protein